MRKFKSSKHFRHQSTRAQGHQSFVPRLSSVICFSAVIGHLSSALCHLPAAICHRVKHRPQLWSHWALVIRHLFVIRHSSFVIVFAVIWYLSSACPVFFGGSCLAAAATAILPCSGANNATKEVMIYGSGFSDTETVKLTRAEEEIIATDVLVVTENKITCRFDLKDKPFGIYNLWVGEDKLPAAFTIHRFMTPTGWEESEVGAGENIMLGFAVTDADNDGKSEIYCSNFDHRLYQFKWDGEFWQKTEIWETPDILGEMCAEDLDNDEELEIYVGCGDGHLYQFKWDSILDKWDRTDVGSPGKEVSCAVFGDGDNDGKREMYAVDNSGEHYKFILDGTTLREETNLGTTGGPGTDIIIGDADNDGKVEIYTVAEGKIYQFKYDQELGQWLKRNVYSGVIPVGKYITIGDADNNGSFEIYTSEARQLSWEQGVWQERDFDGTIGTQHDVIVGDADNDGKEGVYIISGKDLYQFKYIEDRWEGESIGFLPGDYDIFKVAPEDADNDGYLEIYVTYGNKIWQFKGIDDIFPGKITDLTALVGEGDGEIKLAWSAPGDDEYSGNIETGQYRIKYSTVSSLLPCYLVTLSSISCSPGDSQSYTLNGLKPINYPYYITVRAVDEVGNPGELSDVISTYVQDKTRPSSPHIFPPAPTTKKKIIIRGTTEPNALIRIWKDSQYLTEKYANSDGNFSFEVELDLGENVFKLTATDALLNESPPARVIISRGADSYDDLKVYPNPSREEEIIFSGLTLDTSLKIYNLAGELIKSVTTGGIYKWDLTNEEGQKVSSGVYIYLVTDRDGKKKTEKLAIIR